MQIAGQKIEPTCLVPFALPRPDGSVITFHLSPLPLGFQRQLRQRGLFVPQPPLKISRDSTGKPLRDATGMAVTSPDPADPQFQLDVEIYHQRVAVLAIVEALRNDRRITFSATFPAVDSTLAQEWQNFADAVFAEFEQVGLTPGDLIALCHEICRLSNMLDTHLRDSQANFSLDRLRPPI